MWYYTLNGEQAGPVTEEELRQLLQSQLPSNTLVWQKGMAEWTSFQSVDAFRDIGSTTTTAATGPAISAPTESPSTAAASSLATSSAATPYAPPSAAAAAAPSESFASDGPFSAVDCFKRSWSLLGKRFGDIFLACFIYLIVTLIGSGIVTAVQFSLDASFQQSVTVNEGPEPLTISKPSTSESILEETEGLSIEEALEYQDAEANAETAVDSELSAPESLSDFFEENWEQDAQVHSPFATIVGWILNQMLSSYLLIGFTVAVLAVLRGDKLNIGSMFTQPLGKTGRHFITSIVYGILVTIGFIFLIFPGIYFSLRLMFYSTAIADKNLGIIESLQYSMDITKGKALNLFALGALNFIAVAAGILLLLLGLIWALPLCVVAWLVAYESLRLRVLENQNPG